MDEDDKPTWIPFRDTEITCPHCNKRVSFKVFDAEREIEDLNSQLAQCQERLAVAEGLLNEGYHIGKSPGGGLGIWDDKVIAFLDHTPSDWVAVRKGDLDYALVALKEGQIPPEVFIRLKTSLEGKP